MHCVRDYIPLTIQSLHCICIMNKRLRLFKSISDLWKFGDIRFRCTFKKGDAAHNFYECYRAAKSKNGKSCTLHLIRCRKKIVWSMYCNSITSIYVRLIVSPHSICHLYFVCRRHVGLRLLLDHLALCDSPLSRITKFSFPAHPHLLWIIMILS